MFHLVTGGSGSGKSEYAEGLIMESGAARRFYLATMEVYGAEGRRKVERHRRLRAGKGFETIECPRGLAKIGLDKGNDFGQDLDQECKRDSAPAADKSRTECAVLLECMSNLAANELFGAGEEAQPGPQPGVLPLSSALQRIKKGILHVQSQCELLVVVTNEVFSDGMDYGPETNEYIRLLGQINCWMAQQADKVTEVVYGIPVAVKNGDAVSAPLSAESRLEDRMKEEGRV
ncbi:MAG: bifunctional adenosylcobinamide kinase/adenosylcobinamide-phosphate guanylyltransferase [Lachnospiraceae bacterium]|nr:bifunctional adenosylcobinamide kinase/adenosylcobinamide-phosphate guanylyltransferase [Lachnospiraceae bacterium]